MISVVRLFGMFFVYSNSKLFFLKVLFLFEVIIEMLILRSYVNEEVGNLEFFRYGDGMEFILEILWI